MDFHHAQQHYLSVPALQWAKEPGVQPPQESQTGDEVREAPPEPWDYPQFWTPDSHYFLPVNAINLWQQLFTLNLTTQLGMAYRPKTPAYRKWKQKNNEFNINVGWIAKNQLICKYTKKNSHSNYAVVAVSSCTLTSRVNGGDKGREERPVGKSGIK